MDSRDWDLQVLGLGGLEVEIRKTVKRSLKRIMQLKKALRDELESFLKKIILTSQ